MLREPTRGGLDCTSTAAGAVAAEVVKGPLLPAEYRVGCGVLGARSPNPPNAPVVAAVGVVPGVVALDPAAVAVGVEVRSGGAEAADALEERVLSGFLPIAVYVGEGIERDGEW